MHATLLLSLLLTLALANSVQAQRGRSNPFDAAKNQAANALGIPQSSGLAAQVAVLIIRDQQVLGSFGPALTRAGRNKVLAQALVGGQLNAPLQHAITICQDNEYNDWSCSNALSILISQMSRYYPAARYPSVSDSYPYGFSLYDEDWGF
ncbi:hypothetical protein RI367_007848 [Sorochytrium milnesiophthora]